MTKTPIALTLKGLTTALATLGTKEMASTALVINDLFKILSSRTSGILRKRFFWISRHVLLFLSYLYCIPLMFVEGGLKIPIFDKRS